MCLHGDLIAFVSMCLYIHVAKGSLMYNVINQNILEIRKAIIKCIFSRILRILYLKISYNNGHVKIVSTVRLFHFNDGNEWTCKLGLNSKWSFLLLNLNFMTLIFILLLLPHIYSEHVYTHFNNAAK